MFRWRKMCVCEREISVCSPNTQIYGWRYQCKFEIWNPNNFQNAHCVLQVQSAISYRTKKYYRKKPCLLAETDKDHMLFRTHSRHRYMLKNHLMNQFTLGWWRELNPTWTHIQYSCDHLLAERRVSFPLLTALPEAEFLLAFPTFPRLLGCALAELGHVTPLPLVASAPEYISHFWVVNTFFLKLDFVQ